MGGTVLFQDALKDRLELIKPSRSHFADCIAKHPATLSPGYVYPSLLPSLPPFRPPSLTPAFIPVGL